MKAAAIPQTTLRESLPPLDKWERALSELAGFDLEQYRTDFTRYMHTLTRHVGTQVMRVCTLLTLNPAILLDDSSRAELEALSHILQVEFRLLLLQNLLYECSTAHGGCTVLIARTADRGGAAVMARNVDFEWSYYWTKYTFNAVLSNRQGEEYAIVNFPAVGTISISTGLRFGKFALAINLRKDGSLFDNLMCAMANGSLMPQLLMRRVIENEDSFESAKEQLQNAKLISPCYFSIMGAKDACVLTRDRKLCVSNHQLRADNYLAQTNVDSETQSDDRLHLVSSALHPPVRSESMKGVLCTEPVLNKYTFASFLISMDSFDSWLVAGGHDINLL